MNSPSEFIKSQIDKPPEDSKKWKMSMLGLKGVAGFFAVGVLLFIFMPAYADKVITLTQVAITAWGGVVAIYLGAQGTVEYKSTAALENLNKNETVHEEKIEHIVVEGNPGDVRPWSPAAAYE